MHTWLCVFGALTYQIMVTICLEERNVLPMDKLNLAVIRILLSMTWGILFLLLLFFSTVINFHIRNDIMYWYFMQNINWIWERSLEGRPGTHCCASGFSLGLRALGWITLVYLIVPRSSQAEQEKLCNFLIPTDWRYFECCSL